MLTRPALTTINASFSHAPKLVSFDFFSQGSTRRSSGTAAVTKRGAAARPSAQSRLADP